MTELPSLAPIVQGAHPGIDDDEAAARQAIKRTWFLLVEPLCMRLTEQSLI
uniref:Uncharacterized protein n=1 Tax=Picea glauca TaxID=3330 RepID=A0A101LU01_PICGL|nr:hypothetical protein ABT39_MTgene3399 [Picea glauca]